MGGMAGAVADAGTAIAGKAKEAVAFGVGNIIDSTGIGALTGTGFNGASTGLAALEKVKDSGGVLNAIGDTLKEGVAAVAGGGAGAGGGTPDIGSEMFSAEGFENLTPDGGSEIFSAKGFEASAPDGSGGSFDYTPQQTSFWEQHSNDFMDGLTGNGSSFVRDENGDWDVSRSLAKGAGKFIQNKVSHLGDKKHIDKDFAQEELKRMMAQQMVQG